MEEHRLRFQEDLADEDNWVYEERRNGILEKSALRRSFAVFNRRQYY
jgi:hypothetical protein